MNGQIIFILWRESVEALLVVGILAGWLAHERAPRQAAVALWGGVLLGLALAGLFGLTLLGFSEVLSEELRQDMMTAMVFLAAALIVHMVVWMRAHGPTLKRRLETGLNQASERGHWLEIALLSAVAVAREGSETVVFLYGSLASVDGTTLGPVLASIGVGVAAAVASYAALRAGARFLPWKGFFRFSEAMLLLLGCALFTTGVGDLVVGGLLPFGVPLWDTGWLLDDGSRAGGLVASLTGYRSAPDEVTVAAWVLYWTAVAAILWRQSRRPRLRTA